MQRVLKGIEGEEGLAVGFQKGRLRKMDKKNINLY